MAFAAVLDWFARFDTTDDADVRAALLPPPVGAAAWHNRHGDGTWYRRKVAAVHADGTIDVCDDDGKSNEDSGEKGVKPEHVRGDGDAAVDVTGKDIEADIANVYFTSEISPVLKDETVRNSLIDQLRARIVDPLKDHGFECQHRPVQ